MNILLRELKAHRKALIIWSVCMFLLVISGMAKYTAYSGGGDIGAVFDDMPSTMKALLGMGSFDVTTMSGYFAMLFLYIELTVAIHAVLLGAGIIAKEERDKTTEFLMVKPVSRTTIITAKLVTALINVIVINIVTFVSSLVMVAAYNKGDDISSEIAVFFLSLFIVQLIFLSLGAVLAAIMRNPKSAGSLATGILLLAFMISKVTELVKGLGFLNLLSPFKYFSYVNMVEGEGLNIVIVLLSLVLVAAFVACTYLSYNKRDMNI